MLISAEIVFADAPANSKARAQSQTFNRKVIRFILASYFTFCVACHRRGGIMELVGRKHVRMMKVRKVARLMFCNIDFQSNDVKKYFCKDVNDSP